MSTSARIIRVFPSKTKATPDDELSYFGPPDMLAEADEVHVSATFTWDKPRAEWLADQWQSIAPVKIGGVAYGDTSLRFIPGRYIKSGYTITSRGCPRRCYFCDVWHKWPTVNVLPIIDGWNVLDDNLLAAPRPHVEAVFAMLRRQTRQAWPEWDGRIQFTGGLEALALEDYQVGLLADLKPRPNMFFAYDPGDAFETLESAARRLLAAGFTARSHPVALLRDDRRRQRHARRGRGAAKADDGDRLHAVRDAVEAIEARRDALCAWARMERLSSLLVPPRDHPRRDRRTTSRALR